MLQGVSLLAALETGKVKMSDRVNAGNGVTIIQTYSLRLYGAACVCEVWREVRWHGDTRTLETRRQSALRSSSARRREHETLAQAKGPQAKGLAASGETSAPIGAPGTAWDSPGGSEEPKPGAECPEQKAGFLSRSPCNEETETAD